MDLIFCTFVSFEFKGNVSMWFVLDLYFTYEHSSRACSLKFSKIDFKYIECDFYGVDHKYFLLEIVFFFLFRKYIMHDIIWTVIPKKSYISF